MAGGSVSRIAGARGAESAAAPARLDWIDALKGVGIVAVVAGHVWWHSGLRDVLYSFHMPLFFMVSGYLARPMPFRLLAPRLLRSLGLPLLSFSALLLGADFLIEGARGMRPIFPSAGAGISTMMLATETLRGPFAVLWFVPCLALARLAWNGLLLLAGTPRARTMVLTMIGVALLAWAADVQGTRSPLGLRPVPAALLLLWLGALWREWRPPLLVLAPLWLLALAALFWFPPLNMRAGDLGWPVLGMVGAAAIVERLGAIVGWLPSVPMRLFAWLGRASLVIMFVHIAFIHYLAPYLPKVALFAVGLAGSLLVAGLARRSGPGRLLLLGEARALVKTA